MTAIEIQSTAADKPIVSVLAGLRQAIIDKFGPAKADTGAHKTMPWPDSPVCLRQQHDKNISTIARIDPAILTMLMGRG